MGEVVLRLRGGLGNQLFQYAAALGLAQDPRVFSYGEGWGPGHLDLADFGVQLVYPNRLVRSTVPGLCVRESLRDSFSQISASVMGRLGRVQVLRQHSPFSERPSRVSARVVLDGWFQDRSWWQESWGRVVDRLLTFEPAAVSKLRTHELVVIKVRRSDYLREGWELPSDYYERALDLLGIHGQEVMVVAEDDEGRTFLEPILAKFGCKAIGLPHVTGNPNADDFWITASAHTIIQANSSYSWWAAAIATAKDPQSRVVYPDPWLPNRWGPGRVPDLGLTTWEKVTVSFDPQRTPGAGATD